MPRWVRLVAGIHIELVATTFPAVILLRPRCAGAQEEGHGEDREALVQREPSTAWCRHGCPRQQRAIAPIVDLPAETALIELGKEAEPGTRAMGACRLDVAARITCPPVPGPPARRSTLGARREDLTRQVVATWLQRMR